MRKRRHRHRPEHQLLAQILLHSIGETTTPCQGDIHQKEETPAQAEWEIRMYQDVEMTLDLVKRGVPREQINQKIWDAACKEQDAVGIVNHKTMYLCSECVRQIASHHAGAAQATLCMMTAMLTRGSFLLVSDRVTEDAAMISGLGRDVQETDLLERIDNAALVNIRMKR